jgi:ABC-type antimicrobial peptide transport system permease subunit
LKQVTPRSGSWLAGTTIRRSGSQWRLIAVVLVVAILATTLISSLGLLVTATEQGAIRNSLARVPAAQTDIDVQVQQSLVPLARTRSLTDAAVKSVLGGSATASSTAAAFTEPGAVSGSGTTQSVAYFAELDDVRSNAKLTAGVWAGKPSGKTLPVDVPSAAASTLGYTIGSEFSMANGSNSVPVRVVGIYRPDDPASSFWNLDPLQGLGSNSTFPVPGDNSFQSAEAFGPLIAAPGEVTAAGINFSVVDLRYRLHFSRTTVAQLAPLVRRLSNADTTVSLSIGDTAQEADYTSNADAAVSGVASGLIVTRSTVIVVSLLLLILAVVAMGQTARLLTESRAGERQLMRSRGASGANIIALTTVEALILGLLTAGISPLLANLVYRVIATQPAMVSAGMPRDAGLPSITWETAGGIAVLFVIVLVLPLVGQARTFVEGEQAKGRQRARSGLMRSGLDIAFVVVAAIAYWQLKSYNSPESSSVSISVDPVLVAGPALVLLAGALLSVRLIPAAARIMDRIGSRARGSVVSLAAWEIGRRSQRATAAVLLLSLALGVGSFGISFLDTWRQSQVDQASLAVGPPVRVPAVAATAQVQASDLARGAVSTPQPVIRATAQVTSQGQGGQGNSSDGASATVLGLTPSARSMIDRGRLASEGGSRVNDLLHLKAGGDSGIVLPGVVRGVSATLQIGGKALPGVAAKLHAIVEDSHGLLTTVSLGRVAVDGKPHTVTGLLQPVGALKGLASPLRIVGMQSTFFAPASDGTPANPSTKANLLVTALGVLHPASTGGGTYSTQAIRPTASTRWHAVTANPSAASATSPAAPAGALFDLAMVIPADVQTTPASFALVGWDPVYILAGVLPTAFATVLGAQVGDTLTAVVDEVQVHVLFAGTAHLIPGSATADVLTSGSTGLASSASQADMIVVDQTLLARTLAQSGAAGPQVSEWWVDVAAHGGAAYLRAHPGANARSSDVLGVELQQAPLRVATQAALWLAILAGALLAAVGFIVHSATTMRARRLELAQLRAIGLSRNKLVGLFAVESVLLAVLGAVFGLSIGLLLVWLVGPLVAVSPDGSAAVPSVVVEIPWTSIALLLIGLAAVLALVVLVVARVQRFVEPAQLLRDGSEL